MVTRRHAALAPFLVATLGCPAPEPGPITPNNVSPPVAIPPAPADVGHLALVHHGMVADPTRTIAEGTPVVVVDDRGTRVSLTAGAPGKLAYGCDGNQLDVTPLGGAGDGAALHGDVAWVPPPNAKPLAIAIRHEAIETEAQYRVGSVNIELMRASSNPARGRLDMFRSGHLLVSFDFERQLMDGADPSYAAIDLRERGPHVPVPVAAWSADGWQLVVLERPGWEGTSFEVYVVDIRGARHVDALDLSLYRCAF